MINLIFMEKRKLLPNKTDNHGPVTVCSPCITVLTGPRSACHSA